MFSSCVPLAAFVEGVNIGRGESFGLLQSLGRRAPCTVPSARYSFHAEPGEVAAHDALDRQHLGATHDHHAPRPARRVPPR